MAQQTLPSAPNLPLLYGKALLTSVGRGGELPDTEVVLPDHEIDPGHLAQYDRVCGYRLTDRLPSTYPHILAFPLAMKLMTDRSFPFALPGLVHVRNVSTQHRPLEATDRPTIRVRAADLRPHRKGRQVDVVATVEVGGEPVWTERSTYLSRGNGDPSAPDEPAPQPPTQPVATWKVPGDVGRRYAAVAGDVNPIHLHPLGARLFGFPRTIAHGMWFAARGLAALEGRIPDAHTVDLRFMKPMLVPATVHLATRRTHDGWDIAVRTDGRGTPHLVGAVREA